MHDVSGVVSALIRLLVIILLTLLIRAFAKLRKATVSFVMSVCPFYRLCLSVRPHGTTQLPRDGFPRNLIFYCISKIVEKIQVLLKSEKINGYFT